MTGMAIYDLSFRLFIMTIARKAAAWRRCGRAAP
jgi:hypothetical protein